AVQRDLLDHDDRLGRGHGHADRVHDQVPPPSRREEGALHPRQHAAGDDLDDRAGDHPGGAGAVQQKGVGQLSLFAHQRGSEPGADDNWVKEPGRPIDLPAHRPIEVQLSSKDVIHDFFLPNFRVKLDAVPGMRGRIFFMSEMTSKQREEASRHKYTIDELDAALKLNPNAEFTAVVREDLKSEGAEYS